MKLDMNQAWQQGISLVGANWQLLLVLAGIFLFLPSVAITVMMPDIFSGLGGMTEPEEVNAWMMDNWPQFAGATAVATFFQFIGYMAMIALMGAHRPTVGEALKISVLSLPSMIAAFVIFVVAYLIFVLILSLIIGLIVGGLAAAGLGEGGAVAIAFLFMIPLVIAQFWLMSRLSLTMPAMVIERRLNPFSALARSWRLTSSSGFRLFVFYALLTIAYFVILMVVSLFAAGIFGLATESSTAVMGNAIITGLLGAAFAMIFSGIVVAIHHQLAGPDSEAVSETFE
tara:strand:+ start:326 stop:1180 length:855 start_codon:yes stop_codon:yes gene_type:complete